MSDPQDNSIIEIFSQVFGCIVWTYNLQDSYIDEGYPWNGILKASNVFVCSRYYILKGNFPKTNFGDTIFPIKHIAK